MGIQKIIKDFKDWCPQPSNPFSSRLRHYALPIAAVFTTALLLSVSLVTFSNLVSQPFAPIVPIVSNLALTAPTVLWNFSTGHPVYSPAVGNGAVYVGTSGSNIYAFNASSGEIVWNYTSDQEAYSSPTFAVTQEAVYVGGFNNVFAINSKTGTTLWNDDYGEDARYFFSPTVVNGVVYSGAEEGGMSAFNAKNGAQLWNYVANSSVYVSSAATIANGRVYFAASGQFYALNDATGTKLWNYTMGDFGSTPCVSNGIVYVGAGANSLGILYALNATDGYSIWNYTTPYSPFYASPIEANNEVYITSGDGTVYAFNAFNGVELWNYRTATYAGSGSPTSTPAVINGVVYTGSGNGNVYAFNATSGQKLWSLAVSNTYLTSPAIANGVLYIGSADGSIYALKVANASPTATPKTTLSNTQLTIIIVLVTVIVAAAIVLVVRRKMRTKGE